MELLYFVLLARAYDSGEVSVVYPVARGVAPALVLIAGIVVLGIHRDYFAAGADITLISPSVSCIFYRCILPYDFLLGPPSHFGRVSCSALPLCVAMRSRLLGTKSVRVRGSTGLTTRALHHK